MFVLPRLPRCWRGCSIPASSWLLLPRCSALYAMAARHRRDMLERLVALGADINHHNRCGDTPLHSMLSHSRPLPWPRPVFSLRSRAALSKLVLLQRLCIACVHWLPLSASNSPARGGVDQSLLTAALSACVVCSCAVVHAAQPICQHVPSLARARQGKRGLGQGERAPPFSVLSLKLTARFAALLRFFPCGSSFSVWVRTCTRCRPPRKTPTASRGCSTLPAFQRSLLRSLLIRAAACAAFCLRLFA